MKEIFDACLKEASAICILGHISPDGDCVGSTLSLWNYIGRKYPGKKRRVFLEPCSGKFSYLPGFSEICTESVLEKSFDLCIVCDCASLERTGRFQKYYDTAKKTFLIDHHITNTGFGDYSVIVPEASSASEVVYGLLDAEMIGPETAVCIYTGIIHDTGVFKYNTTGKRTMEIAGACMAQGIDFGTIIDSSFYSMSYCQKKLLGEVLEHAYLSPKEKLMAAVLDRETMLRYGIENTQDTDGFVENLRNTDGVYGAAFFYQLADCRYKASLRSNSDDLDVSVIAQKRGGGGHRRAAGCMLSENYKKDIEDIIREAEDQITGR